MISISHWKKISKSKPTEVWCLDPLGEHSIRFDRLSLCSQIKAIPIEDMVAMLEDLKKEMNPIKECEHQIYGKEGWHFVGKCQDVIQHKIDALKE